MSEDTVTLKKYGQPVPRTKAEQPEETRIYMQEFVLKYVLILYWVGNHPTGNLKAQTP